MKKALVLLLALAMVLSLAACGSAPASTPAEEPAAAAAAAEGEVYTVGICRSSCSTSRSTPPRRASRMR